MVFVAFNQHNTLGTIGKILRFILRQNHHKTICKAKDKGTEMMNMKFSLNYRMANRLSMLVPKRKLANCFGVFVVVVVCIKFSMMRNNVVDITNKEWPNISGEIIKRKLTLNKVDVGEDSNILKLYNVSTTNVWIPRTTRESNLNTSEKHRKTVTDYSSKQKVYKNHPNERDFQMIASGKFIVEDIMKQGPFKLLKNYKSPCWKQSEKNSLEPPIRCLPYFYLIGAPKAGTTDMRRRLIKHPEISKLVVKGPHWLTRKHYYDHGENGGYSNLTHYINIFRNATREVVSRNDSGGFHNVIFGDCSVSTLWDNDYWTILPEFRNLSEPLYTNADYIHHLNPNAKIIVMLRNPVERLYSEYLFFQHGSPQMFHQSVKNTLKDTYNCLRNNSLRHCLYTPLKYRTGIKVQVRIGVYHLHLKEFFRVFPREQIMVIKLEDFSSNTASYMKQIFLFLEITTLNALNANDLKGIADPDQHANKRKMKDKKAGEMLHESRKMLENFYRPHNDLLSDLLGQQFNYNRDIVSVF